MGRMGVDAGLRKQDTDKSQDRFGNIPSFSASDSRDFPHHVGASSIAIRLWRIWYYGLYLLF